MASLPFFAFCAIGAFLSARNYKWLPFMLEYFPYDHFAQEMRGREAIHNSVTRLKRASFSKRCASVGKPFIIPCPRLRRTFCLDMPTKIPNRVINQVTTLVMRGQDARYISRLFFLFSGTRWISTSDFKRSN